MTAVVLDPWTPPETDHSPPAASPPPRSVPTADDLLGVVATFAKRQMLLSYSLIGLLDGVEHQDMDSDLLERVYAIDHIGSQIRRSAENLLLISGGDVADPSEGPISLLDVARAAQFESVSYAEVKITAMPPGALAPGTSDDVCHLLAELLDNAVTFSARSTVTLLGRANPDGGIVLEVSDTGVGIPQPVLARLNALLSSPPVLDVRLTQHMGMTIVAGLARRHGLVVQLSANSSGGTTATVAVPARLIVTSGPVQPVPTVVASVPVGATDRWGAVPSAQADGSTPSGLPRRVSTLRRLAAQRQEAALSRPPDPRSVFLDFSALEEGERLARAHGVVPDHRTATTWEGPWDQ